MKNVYDILTERGYIEQATHEDEIRELLGISHDEYRDIYGQMQELISKSEELLYVLERDKDVSEKKWWLDQRAQLAEAIDNAKKC